MIVAVLDNIRSLYNVGSIFRTADALGIEKLYLCGITGTPDHPRFWRNQTRDPDSIFGDDQSLKKTIREQAEGGGIAKTALSGFETVPWTHSEDTVLTLKRLKDEGFYITGLEIHESSRVISSVNQRPLAIVVGHEREGLSPDLIPYCDELMHIPMLGHGVSLNVAVAFGIGAYTILH